MRIVTANVNGIRAARRRGGVAWLAAQGADVIALQEVRATRAQLQDALADHLTGWHVALAECSTRGRSGVAVLTREVPTDVRIGVGPEEFDESGRWVEVDLAVPGGILTVASVYVHTGEAGTERQHEKYRFLDAMTSRMKEWSAQGALAVVVGDLNVCHREADLKNWKGNRGSAGFLPQERAYLDGWFGDGDGEWVDVHRTLHGEGPGPYTWWSWRGKAFDNDAGWRIDYQVASRLLASRARAAEVGRAESYAARWSDHAALTVDYALG